MRRLWLVVPVVAAAGALATCRVAARRPAPRDDATRQSSVSGGAASRGVKFDHHLAVDQFGYRPGDPKFAVIRDPVHGYDAGDRFTPGAVYEVRRAEDGAVVLSGPPVPWNRGATEDSSGDRGWWLDFSSLKSPGTYFVEDPARQVRSATFTISARVYRDVLKAAARMFFYQRSGVVKSPPYADPCWQDTAAYLGPGQDAQAHDITDPHDAAKVRDLSGGWFDAGDTNKYVKNAIRPVHQLLTAYEQTPGAFGDDFDLPESGNGVPDVLDEVKWELDWLEKMQSADGSAALKVGGLDHPNPSPPSSDRSARFYVPSCSSATIAVAGMFAHAAYVYRGLPALRAAAGELQSRAVRAWTQYQGVEPKQEHCDDGRVKEPGADLSAAEQGNEAVVAAAYLFATTGDARYQDYVRAHYKELRPYHDIGWSRYDPEQGRALLFYAALPGADPALAQAIRDDHATDVRAGNQVYGLSEVDDLYRSFLHDAQYHWGSSEVRADYGNANMDALPPGAPAADAEPYRARALDTLHYFHGVNPFAKVYLSNMARYGATSSVSQIFHAWFHPHCNRLFCTDDRWSDAETSECGPAPGYVPGGPVANIGALGVPASLVPPSGQPPQKSFRESNRADPDKAYVFAEPSIDYQGAYVRLVSHFAE